MVIDLGRVVPIYRKAYSDNTTYEGNDIVLYTDGNLYWHYSAAPTTGVPPTDDTVWTAAFSGSDLRQQMAGNVAAADAAAVSAQAAARDAAAAQSQAQTAAQAAADAKAGAETAGSAAQTAQAAAEDAAAKAQASAGTIQAEAEQIGKNTVDIAVLTQAIASDAPGIVETAEGEIITPDDSSDRPFQGLTIYGRTTQDGTPTPDAPVELVSVGDGGSVTVNVCGANLLRIDDFGEKTSLGVSFSVSEDVLTISGTATGDYPRALLAAPLKLPKGRCYLSVTDLSGAPVTDYTIRLSVNGFTKYLTPNTVTTISEEYEFTYIILSLFTGQTIPGEMQVRLAVYAITDRSYEAYKPIQSITLYTPNGLPGIPVASGGNYTDADGQQWIANYRDYGRGVDVQSVGCIESYAGEEITTQYISTTGQLSDGATVLYLLDTPVTTPIPEDELAAYAALHTNRPNTTIYSDAGAHMAARYVADTKLYIDRKITELAAAINT